MAIQGSLRGFAAMSPEKRRKIAQKGGQMSGGKFKEGSQRAREAGRRGGSR
ncbi:MAG: stress-induced protein [Candidatus Blackburnbacteria bacterium]|nr:stress-induced protein [Candidatus Blackburnbacteria bacterium]